MFRISPYAVLRFRVHEFSNWDMLTDTMSKVCLTPHGTVLYVYGAYLLACKAMSTPYDMLSGHVIQFPSINLKYTE